MASVEASDVNQTNSELVMTTSDLFLATAQTHDIETNNITPISESKMGIEKESQVFGSPQSEASDPDAVKQPWKTIVAIQIVNSVGVGIFTLGTSLQLLGGVFGMVMLIILGPVTLYSAILIANAQKLIPQATSYLHMSKLTLNSKYWRVLVVFTCVLSVALLNASYFLAIAESLASFTTGWFTLCQPIWGLIAALLLIPSLTVRSMGRCRIFLVVDSIMYTIALLIPTIYMLFYMDTRTVHRETLNNEMTWYSFFNALTMIAFSYSSAFSYVEIINEMAQPSYFPLTIYISGAYQIGFYCLYAGTSYFYFGDIAPGNLIANIPNFETPYRVTALFIGIHMYASYLVKSILLTKNLHQTFFASSAGLPNKKSRSISFMIAICILLFSFFIALVVPRFDILASLTGSITTPWVGFIIPAIYLLRAHKVTQTPISKVMVFVCLAYAAFGFILFTAGTAANVVSIAMDNHTDSHHPFGCNSNPII